MKEFHEIKKEKRKQNTRRYPILHEASSGQYKLTGNRFLTSFLKVGGFSS